MSHRKLRESHYILKQQLRLHHSALIVAIEDLNYYYKSSDFHVFRYGRHLKHLTNPLNLVKFQKIPIIIGIFWNLTRISGFVKCFKVNETCNEIIK